MVDCSVRLIGRRGCGRCGDRQGFDVRHDGVDLFGSEMTDEDLLIRPSLAGTYCEFVNRRLKGTLPSEVILGALINMRKAGKA